MPNRYQPTVRIDLIDNLVFEGGSVKGIAYVGAFNALLQAGLDFKRIKRIGGTSAGSITAALLCLGMSLDEIDDYLLKIDFKEFLDEKITNVRDALLNVKDRYQEGNYPLLAIESADPNLLIGSSKLSLYSGLFDGDVLRNWIEDRLFNKTGIHYLTFAELHHLKKQFPDQFKDLYVIGINNDTGRAQTFSYEETPDAIISDAVRISTCIPFIFKPHQVYCKDAMGNRVLDQKFKNHLFIDGGLTEKYPISLFDEPKYFNENDQKKLAELRIVGKVENPNTLGFKLVTRNEKDFYEGLREELAANKKKGYFTLNVASDYTIKQDSDHIRNKEGSRTIYIDTCGVKTLDFNLTDEKKQSLREAGNQATIDYFSYGPTIVRNTSFLNTQLKIDQNQSVVALINRVVNERRHLLFGKTQKKQHPLIILESINSKGETIFKVYDLFMENRNPNQGIILIAKLKSDGTFDHSEELIQDIITKNGNMQISTWPITREQAKRLDSIIRDEDERLVSHVIFNNNKYTQNLSSNEKLESNRFQWLLEKLDKINIEEKDIHFTPFSLK